MGQLLWAGTQDETWVPTEDDLPHTDDTPLESERHFLQLPLLKAPLLLQWSERQDFYIGTNMFVYYSMSQLLNTDFKGPDVFVALDVPRRERKSWVVWQEGKAPDVVIEILSESTAARDKGEKMRIYRDRLRVPEYFWFDPFSDDWAGFALRNGVYEAIVPDAAGRLRSDQLGLLLTRWRGVYEGVEATWLRWSTPEGLLLPTPQEALHQERERADHERERAEQAVSLLEQERQRAERLMEKLRALGADPIE